MDRYKHYIQELASLATSKPEWYEDGDGGEQWDGQIGASYVVTPWDVQAAYGLTRLVGDETGGIADETYLGLYATPEDAKLAAILDEAKELGEARYWEDETYRMYGPDEDIDRDELPYETLDDLDDFSEANNSDIYDHETRSLLDLTEGWDGIGTKDWFERG